MCWLCFLTLANVCVCGKYWPHCFVSASRNKWVPLVLGMGLAAVSCRNICLNCLMLWHSLYPITIFKLSDLSLAEGWLSSVIYYPCMDLKNRFSALLKVQPAVFRNPQLCLLMFVSLFFKSVSSSRPQGRLNASSLKQNKTGEERLSTPLKGKDSLLCP